MPVDMLPWLASLLPFIFFGAIWIGSLTLVGKISGWGRLRKEFSQNSMQPPLGGDEQTFRWVRGRIGWANYKNCLNVSTNRYGLTLSMVKVFAFGHPPLFIAWDKVKSIEYVRVFFVPLAKITLIDSKQTVLQLPSNIFENNSHVPVALQGAVKETKKPY